MEEFLKLEVNKMFPHYFDDEACVNVAYEEDVNPDAASDAWLESCTSFIYKIGVLSVVDANKCDFATVFIGHQRTPGAKPEFIGYLNWSDGENDDPKRSLARYVKLIQQSHFMFLE